MKKIFYSITITFSLLASSNLWGQGASPENVDVGIFPIGTFNSTPSTNEIFEVAIKTDQAFTAVPAAAELNFYLGAAFSLFNGSEVFGIVEDQLNGGDMIFQSTFPDLSATNNYVAFVYNGSGINLSTYVVGTWTHVFTVTMSGATTLEPEDLVIGDQGSTLYSDYSVRTALNVDFYNEFLPFSSQGALPLNLLSFGAEKFNEKSSLLKWVTANEINTSHFVVQRSYDKSQWYNIGSVGAAGYSLNIENYSFVDEGVYNGVDSRLTVFYRLLMVDIDGRSETSPLKSVVFGSGVDVGREFLVYPNPSSDGVQVEWSITDFDQPTALQFYDINGKLVYTQEVAKNINQQYVDFSSTAIQPGLFILRIMSGDIPLDHKQIVVDKR